MKLEQKAEELTKDFLATIKPMNDSVALMTDIANQMGKANELKETLDFVKRYKSQLIKYTGNELITIVNDMGVQANSIMKDLQNIYQAALAVKNKALATRKRIQDFEWDRTIEDMTDMLTEHISTSNGIAKDLKKVTDELIRIDAHITTMIARAENKLKDELRELQKKIDDK